jgi:hypothetical protein
MIDSLLEPVVLFFVLGFLASLVKVELRLPDAIYDALSIYLLLGIGIKGGLQLAKAENLSSLALPLAGTIFLGLLIPVIAYLILRRVGRINQIDAAALAAHYGSVSAVTFAVVQTFLDRLNVKYEGYSTVLVVVLEIPAIAVGILIARVRAVKGEINIGRLLHEIFLNKSTYLLFGGLAIGFLAGPNRIGPVGVIFVDLFKGFLALFLLEMGIVASRRLGDLKKVGLFLVGFGITMPVISAAIGMGVGSLVGLSFGGAVILATLAASASYIAAPAAMRIALPQANPTLYLTAALGITFPFNIILGIPLYYWMGQVVYGIGG